MSLRINFTSSLLAIVCCIYCLLFPYSLIAAPLCFDDYDDIVVRMQNQDRTTRIIKLKQTHKIAGTEYGLLNAIPGNRLLPDEENQLVQENEDRRCLFAFIAKHSDPVTNYERVANKFAMYKWKEWPRD